MEQLVSIYRPSSHTGYNSKTVETDNPYTAVEQVAVSQIGHEYLSSDYVNTEIENVISIHNPGGMRDTKQIAELTNSINDGQEILHETGLPNMKMVVAPDGRLLLFDGHHTAIAYLKSNNKNLSDVPHIIISRPNFLPISATEISYFFPVEHREKVIEDWLKYTVNWQLVAPNQVEQREILTVGELATALGN